MAPNPTIDVSPAAFSSAAKTFGTARKELIDTVNKLTKTLDANWGCAGTDDTGHHFANSYDPAAFNAVASATDIVNGLGKLWELLEYTSLNHANGNSDAALGDGNPSHLVPPPLPIPSFTAPAFRGAYGGDSDAPFSWGLITRWLQGKAWPNGHQDKLDTVAHAWWTAQTELQALDPGLRLIRGTISEQTSDEVPQILGQIDLVLGDITALAHDCDTLGSACSSYSQALTTAHDEIGKALAELGLTVVGGAIIGSLIGPEGTAGGAVLGAGVRGAAVAARCVRAIDVLDAAITAGAVTAIAGTAIAAGNLTGNLQPLLDAKPTQFNADTTPAGDQYLSTTKINEMSADDILADNGAALGPNTGRKMIVRNVRDKNDIDAIWDKLTDGAAKPGPGEKVTSYLRPDGTRIQYRITSTNSGETIDINATDAGGKSWKIHQPEVKK